MKDIVINTIQPSEILRVGSCEKSDVVSDVFIGNVLHKGEDIPVYFKAYGYKDPHVSKNDRGLVNEIIGYLVCNLYQVPQPEKAFLVLMPKDKLIHLWGDISERLKESYDSSDVDVIPMFATQRLYSKSLSIKYSHSMQATISQLRKWRYFKQALMCDEIMTNTDRLPRNILAANGKDFWLIDNGKLAIEEGTNWQSIGLIQHQNYPNFLADLVLEEVQADRRKGSAIIETALSRLRNITDILPECEFWINNLVSDQDKVDWQKFLIFLRHRDDNVSQLLNDRYWMLL